MCERKLKCIGLVNNLFGNLWSLLNWELRPIASIFLYVWFNCSRLDYMCFAKVYIEVFDLFLLGKWTIVEGNGRAC